MKKTTKSLRSPMAEVRGMGSARHGTSHWWMQRMTALALIPLTFYVISNLLSHVVPNGYDGAVQWLRNPISATFVILALAAGFHHAASGVQVVIEDYVHCECSKLALVILTKFICAAFALLGIVSTAKILFGV
jgi:succinate dehydrogenase / fumarate reductase, membrane anchor subunit